MKSLILTSFCLFSIIAQAKPCKGLIKSFLELYPDQTKEQLFLRFKNVKNKHKFMRAFIPHWYQEAFNARAMLPVHQKLQRTVGQIVGDAHVGNFGFMIDNKGRSLLVLNDFDDVATAPLYLDVMRLSQSASYALDEVKQAKFIEAYRKGLTNSKHEFADFTKKLGVKSQSNGMKTKADFAQGPGGKRFATKGEPNFPTTKAEVADIEKVLEKQFGSKIKLHDSYRTMKESGGSAFGKRYHLLAEMDGQVHLIELKEITDTGVIAQFAKKVPNDKRILSARDNFLGKDFDQTLTVVKVDEKPYQLRFKAEGNKSIDLAKVDEKELHKVVEDEFFTLGQLHRKSLTNSSQDVEDYVKELDSVTTDEWKDSVKVMKGKVKDAYDKATQ